MLASSVPVIHHYRRYHAKRASEYSKVTLAHPRLPAYPSVLQIAHRRFAEMQDRKSSTQTAELEQRVEQQRAETEAIA